MEPEATMARGTRRSDFAHAFSKALGLPRTAAAIVGALARARRALAVDEIVRRVRSSERSVRENLRILLRRGILIRKVFVTANKKLAYAYSLGSIESLVAAAKRDVARTLARIEAVARRVRTTNAQA
jgi:predicted DNA-binding transcriptional regulator